MHSWLVRDTPPKARAPVSLLAANNNFTSMPSLDTAAEEMPEVEGRLPKRFACELLIHIMFMTHGDGLSS